MSKIIRPVIILLRFFDYLIAGYIFIFWIIVIVIPLKIKGLFTSSRTLPKDIVFLSYEGYKVAPTRIRCYNFSNQLRHMSKRAEVYAYWDRIYKFKDIPINRNRRFWTTEKIIVDIIAFLSLARKGKIVIIEQRPNYDFLVPLFLSFANNSTVIIDIDDWTLDYFVIRPVKVIHILKIIGNYSKTCIAASHHLEKELKKYIDKVYIIPSCVDTNAFVPQRYEPSVNQPVIFSWNGTLFHDFDFANVFFIISCFIKLQERLNDTKTTRLEIAGAGKWFTKICKLVNEDYKSYNITFRNWINPEDMPRYIQGIDVGLFALTEDSHFQCSKSPSKVFEYMACGKPTIATRLGEVSYIIEDGKTGFLVSNRNEFVEKMELLTHDKNLRQNIGRNARETAEKKYSLTVAGKMLYDILREI